ncbi:MAG: hypothetical protein U1C51_01470 [Candidatus Izemoplasmatales bacterium]|nr:hypothetical protein [Candidatus Izemoplasmatales bacterium]
MEDNQQFINVSKKSFIRIVIMLLSLVLLAGMLTYFVPIGSYLRNELGEIIGPYTPSTQVAGLAIWKIILSPIFVLFSSDAIAIIMISIFLLVLGGTFQLMQETKGIQVIIERLVTRFHHNKYLLIRVLVLLFMIFGAFFGIFEESMAMMPIIILLSISLGFDTLLGIGMSLMAAAFGFASAITNPFSVGIASNIAGINILSGVWLRIVVFIIMYVLLSTFLVKYAKKIEKNPKASLSYEEDLLKKDRFLDIVDQSLSIQKRKTIYTSYVWLFVVLMAVIMLISLIEVFFFISIPAIPVMALVFLLGGLMAGKKIIEQWIPTIRIFVKGALSVAPALFLILLAASVKYIITEALILDTILHSLELFMSSMSPYLGILLIYLFILILKFFIGSASTKAILIMPILIPLVRIIGISEELAILAFVFGDGYTNIIFPTNAVLLIGLSVAGISYAKWFKWTFKLQLIVLLITSIVLVFAFAIGY